MIVDRLFTAYSKSNEVSHAKDFRPDLAEKVGDVCLQLFQVAFGKIYFAKYMKVGQVTCLSCYRELSMYMVVRAICMLVTIVLFPLTVIAIGIGLTAYAFSNSRKTREDFHHHPSNYNLLARTC